MLYDKPAAFVSYGGQSGGLRAVEQLRQVFAALRVVTMREKRFAGQRLEPVDEAGRFWEPAAADRALAGMLGQLDRWSKALREFRASGRRRSRHSGRRLGAVRLRIGQVGP